MPYTVSYLEGDGVKDDRIALNIQLPDTDGGSLIINGIVQAKGAAPQAVTGSPLTIPAHPGSGSIYYNVQVDVTTGAATLQQSTVSAPVAINGNNRIVCSQTLGTTTTNDALTAETTPTPPVTAADGTLNP